MIRAGDTVMQVWGCCAELRAAAGKVFTVPEVIVADAMCDACGTEFVDTEFAAWRDGDRVTGVPLAWLSKLGDPDCAARSKRAREAAT